MKIDPIIIETEINAPVDKVWEALTQPEEISQWFYIMEDFEPKVGYRFTFYTGGEEEKYKHICTILEVKPGQKLVYSWQYEDVDGDSIVSFLLNDRGEKTLLTLRHTGVESFPQTDPLFSRDTLQQECKETAGMKLKEYIETRRED